MFLAEFCSFVFPAVSFRCIFLLLSLSCVCRFHDLWNLDELVGMEEICIEVANKLNSH
jgi:hypothetical protein